MRIFHYKTESLADVQALLILICEFKRCGKKSFLEGLKTIVIHE